MTEDEQLPPFHPDRNRRMFPDAPCGPGNPEWFLTPEEVAQLSEEELRAIAQYLYENGNKAALNSLYGAANYPF